jgi:serine protease Do
MTRLRSLLIGSLLVLLTGLPAFGQDSLLGKLQDEIRDLARQAGPAIVKVTAERELRLPRHLLERMQEFGNAAHLQKSVMVGTGFLVSESGLVLTTHRMAEGTEVVNVTLADGTEREGSVVGSDPFFKVALIRIDPVEGVTPLTLAADCELPTGSLGVFVGNSFGISTSMSLGIVTGTGKRTSPMDPYDNYVVMNSPILPGDAGGPVLGPGGFVVGMAVANYAGGAMQVVTTGMGRNVSISGLTPPSAGMGLVVPAADLAFAVREIEGHGRVREGILGVSVGIGTLVVNRVRPETPAAAAGLTAGDVLETLEDRPLRNDAEFGFRLRRMSVGVQFRLVVRREGEQVKLTCGLEDVVQRIARLLDGMRIDSTPAGLLVTKVGEKHEAAGVQSGDVIIMVGRSPVITLKQMVDALVTARDEPIRLVLDREGERVEVELSR